MENKITMLVHTIETKQDFLDLQKYTTDNSYAQGKVTTASQICRLQFEDHEQFEIQLNNFNVSERNVIYTWVQKFNVQYNAHKPHSLVTIVDNAPKLDPLIFGKDNTENIVSLEVKDNVLEIFKEKDGIITTETRENKFWIVSNMKFDANWLPLEGKLHYRFIKYYDKRAEFYADKAKYRQADTWSVSDAKESAMVLQGLTYYKGMKVEDVSILHFDIESTGLNHDNNSRVLLISNTFVRMGKVERKLFAYDEYQSDTDFFKAWISWVQEKNPSILCGHNIFSYDLPYMNFCAKRNGIDLNLGRDGSVIKFDKYSSKFRKDGSQDYEYNRSWVYGREIIDTLFVAYHFDFARKYESYGLKQIIKQEGLEVKDRVFYDAGKIWENYKNPLEWEKIKQYAIHDADDAMSLYNLMINSYFYFTRSVPKSFQQVNFSATGSQLNSLLVRSYIQNCHSIPKASEPVKYPGAISHGYPGLHSNVFKIDCVSLYPSIMIQYSVYDKEKDPKANFLNMVIYFTKERLENKRKSKETGDRYYKDLEQSGKIAINSAYGLLGSVGLPFNSPSNAALVTQHGRDILKRAILWCTGNEYIEKTEEVIE